MRIGQVSVRTSIQHVEAIHNVEESLKGGVVGNIDPCCRCDARPAQLMVGVRLAWALWIENSHPEFYSQRGRRSFAASSWKSTQTRHLLQMIQAVLVLRPAQPTELPAVKTERAAVQH